MARTWRGERPLASGRIARSISAFGILHRQSLLPVFPVAIFDAYGDRRTNCLSVTHPRQYVRRILFNTLATAAPVAQLPPVQFTLNEFGIHRQSRRQSGNPANQSRPVRFSRRNESQHVIVRPSVQARMQDSTGHPHSRKAIEALFNGILCNLGRKWELAFNVPENIGTIYGPLGGRVLLTALLVLLVASRASDVSASKDECAQTAHMRIYSNAYLSGDVVGYDLALEQRNDSAVDALLYLYQGQAHDDGIRISGSLSGKKLTLKGSWVEHRIEYP